MHSPRVSVVLPVLNEGGDLQNLLEELRRQISPPGGYEVLVVDGGSADGTRAIVNRMAAEWPDLQLLDNPGRRSAPARNLGVAAAKGRLVVFVDGHCSLPREDYLRRLAELFDSSGADCLCRPQPLARLARSRWAMAVALARPSPLGHYPGSDIYGTEAGFTNPRSAGAAYRREVLERLGGFDERFDACEDVEFNHRVARAGFRAYVHPELAVQYRPRETPGSFFGQMFRYGRGRGRLLVRHPALIPWPLVGSSVLVFAGLALPVLKGTVGLGWLALAITSWLVICFLEGIRLGGLSTRGALVALALVVVHAGLTLGFWRGLLEFRSFRSPMTESASGTPGVGHVSF